MSALELYLARIRQTFPELSIATAEINTDGLANTIILIDNSLVCRFANTEWAQERLSIEHRVLQLIQPFITLPTPIPHLHANDFVSYSYIVGRALSREDLMRQSLARRTELIDQLAQFLKELHTIPITQVYAADIPSTYVTRSVDDWKQFYKELNMLLFPKLQSYARTWITNHFAPVISGRLTFDYPPTLIHADLRPYHILYADQVPTIAGIIDFGTAGVGDPAEDLANIMHGFGESIAEQLYRIYPELAAFQERARFLAGTFELLWAVIGLRSNDTAWFFRHIGRARDIQPIYS